MFRGTLLQRSPSQFLQALALSTLVACNGAGGGSGTESGGDLGEVGPIYDAPAVEDSALVSKTALLSYANAVGRTKAFGESMEVTPTLLNTTPGAITSCEVKPGTRALPSWLSIDSETCVLSGTATASLTSTTYTIRVTNNVGSTTDASLTLSVTPKIPILEYASTATVLYGEAFSITPSTLDVRGSNVSNCIISSGTTALPKWITLNKQTCALTGTPPAAMAAVQYSIQAKNYAGYSSAATITITSAPNTPVLSYVGAKKTAGTFGVEMAVAPTTFSARGATVSSCGIKSGTTALPSWASVDSNCVIRGTPDAVLSSTTYTLVATNSAGLSNDATVALSVSVGKPLLSYFGATTTSGTLGQAFTLEPTSFGGQGTGIKSCVIKDGSRALPSWASLNSSTCVISGTPTAVSSGSAYTVRVTNNNDLFTDATVSFAILADYPMLAYSSSVPAGKVGSLMTVTPSTLNAMGDAIRTCALKSGSPALPSGFTAPNRTTCVITGTPVAPLSATTYTVVATNNRGVSNDATVTLSVEADRPIISYSRALGTSGSYGNAMTISPTTKNTRGADIEHCRIKSGTTALPSWATIDDTTCVISGTPDAISSGTYQIEAENSAGVSDAASVSITVAAGLPTLSYENSTNPTIGTGDLLGGTSLGVVPEVDLKGAPRLISCTIRPKGSTAVPSWLLINSSTCVLSGTARTALTNAEYYVRARSTVGYSSDTVVTLNVEQVNSIAISANNNQTGVVGQALASPFTAIVKDGSNAVVQGAVVDWTVLTGGGSLSSASSSTNASGLSSSTLTLGTATGSQTVKATLRGTTNSVTFTATAAPGALNNFLWTSVPSSATAGSSFNATVTARDAYNNVKTDYTGIVQFSSSDSGSPTLPSNYTYQVSDAGVKEFLFTLKTAGNRTLTVAENDGSPTATTSSIAVAAGSASLLAFSSQPTETRAGQTISSMTVRATDAYSNTVTSFTGDVTLAFQEPSGNPGSSTLSGTHVKTAVAGIATFNDISLNKVGEDYGFKATSSGLTQALSANFNVIPGALSKFVFTNVPGAVAVDAPFNMTVTAFDAQDNVKTDFTGTVTFTSNDGDATLPANYSFVSGDAGAKEFSFTFGTAGSAQTFTANSGGVGSTSAGIVVNDRVTIAFSAAAVQASGSVPYTVTGGSGNYSISIDNYGSIDNPNGNGSYSPGGTPNITTVITVYDNEYGDSATASVDVLEDLAVSFVSNQVESNSSIDYNVTGGSGSYSLSISFGSLSNSSGGGSFSPGGTTGTATLTVTDAAGFTASADVLSYYDPPPVVNISVASSSIYTNQTTTYTISDGSGDYAVSVNAGSIDNASGNGTFDPGGATGTYTISVYDNVSGASNSVDVTVTTEPFTVSVDYSAISPSGSTNYTISGGSGSYSVSVSFGYVSNSSGNGTFYPDGGAGTATISVYDYNTGATTSTDVLVQDALGISADSSSIYASGSTPYQVSGGSGNYAVSVNMGSIDNAYGSGTYSPNGNTGTATLSVYDNSLGTTATALVTVSNDPLTVTVDNSSISSSSSANYTIHNGSGSYSVSVNFGYVSNSGGDGTFYPNGSDGTATISVYDYSRGLSASVDVSVSGSGYGGCTNSNALNYDSGASWDDGSCYYAVSISADNTSVGYNSSVNYSISGGSGNYSVSVNFGYVSASTGSGTFYPQGNMGTATISVYDNSWGQSASVNVDSYDDSGYGGCTNSSALNYDSGASWDNGSCYYAVSISADNTSIGYNSSVNYSISNGSGNYSVSVNFGYVNNSYGTGTFYPSGNTGTATITVYDTSWGHSASVNVDSFDDSGGGGYGGCTDGGALNYDSGASWDNGSCQYAVSISADSSYIGYNSSTNYSISGGSGNYSVSVSMGYVSNGSGSGTFYPNGSTGTATITVYDNSWGQSASVNVDSYDDSGGGGGGGYGGCTDGGALNYDSGASWDDGSCQYPVSISIDNGSIGYNSSAYYTISNGSGNYSVSVNMGYIDSGSGNGNYYPSGSTGTATITVYDNSWGQSASVNVDSYDDSGGGGGGVSAINLTVTSTAIALGSSTTYSASADCGVSSLDVSNGAIDNTSGSGTFIASSATGPAQISLYDGCGQSTSVQIDVFEVASIGFGDMPRAENASIATGDSNLHYMFGGAVSGTPTNDLYAYSSSTDIWKKLEPLGTVPEARSKHAAAWLNSKLYIFGGSGSGVSDVLYEYNPSVGNDGAWRTVLATGSVPSGLERATLSAVGSKLYLIGGYDPVIGDTNDIYEFDPGAGDDGTWTLLSPAGDSFAARSGHSATVIGSDIYVFGGVGTSYFNDLMIYHIANNTWETVSTSGSPPTARAQHGAQYNGSMLLIYGGIDAGGAMTNAAIYDVSNNSWNSSPQLDGLNPYAMPSPLIFGDTYGSSYLYGVDTQSGTTKFYKMGLGASSVNFLLMGDQYGSINGDGSTINYTVKGGTGSYWTEADSGTVSNGYSSGTFSPSSPGTANLTFSDAGLMTTSYAHYTTRSLEIVANNSKVFGSASLSYQVRGGSGNYTVTTDNGSIDNGSGNGTLSISASGTYTISVYDNSTAATASFTINAY